MRLLPDEKHHELQGNHVLYCKADDALAFDSQTRVKNFLTGFVTLNCVSPGGKWTKSPALISTGSPSA